VLYGGAGGGGKSSALLMAALQFVQIPGYSAMLLRRTYADLAKSGALMDRAADWLSGRARWNGTEHRWTFPSGAILEFGYLDNERDRDNYRSAEYQFIGFDEVTTFREADYRFLFSRLRRLKASPIPIRMRGATNPGGIGHEWVKARFITGEQPGRRFLPARLADNPFLDAEEYIRSLDELDPITRAQILAGDWEAYQGGRFQKEWLRKRFRRDCDYYIAEGRQTGSKSVTVFQTCDHAATVQRTIKDDPDYTVVSTWGLTPEKLLLWIECERFRAELPDVLGRVQASWKRHNPAFVCIEGGGTQKGLGQLARRLGIAVKDYLPGNKDKLQRALRAIVLAESGRLYLADGGSWVEEACAELLRFTGDPKRDSHDDIVDTFSMAADILPFVEQGKSAGVPTIMGGR